MDGAEKIIFQRRYFNFQRELFKLFAELFSASKMNKKIGEERAPQSLNEVRLLLYYICFDDAEVVNWAVVLVCFCQLNFINCL